MQTIVEVSLEGPGELRVLDIARMNRGAVGIETEAPILQLDHQFDHAVVLPGRELKERMFILRGLL